MKITGNDLKKIISECIRQIMEVRGALDDRMKGLAELIIKRIKSGEDKFTLSREELAEYYPYKHIPNSLNVQVKNFYRDITGIKGSYGLESNTVSIDDSLISLIRNDYYSKKYEPYILEVVMHELTHFVNHWESQADVDSLPRPMKMDSTGPSKITKRILYLFNKGEMNARATELKWELERRKAEYGSLIPLKCYDNITRLSDMRDLIDTVTKDIQPSDDQPLSVVEILLQSRGHRNMQKDGRERMLNPSTQDFEKAKEAIVKKMTIAYNKFYRKISKVYYDVKNPS